MDNNYSKREIDMQFNALKQHIEDSHRGIDEKLTLILNQTTKTNGRVSSLEKWRTGLSASVGALTPVTLWIVYQIVTQLIK